MRKIVNATLEDIERELCRMLNDGIRSPEVRLAATNSIIPDDEVYSVYEWAKQHYDYVPDPENAELFIAPRIMVERINDNGVCHGDCDDASLLLASLLGSIGYDVKLSLLDTDMDMEYDHCICSVRINNDWVDLDLAVKDIPPGWIEQYLKRKDIHAYYNIRGENE